MRTFKNEKSDAVQLRKLNQLLAPTILVAFKYFVKLREKVRERVSKVGYLKVIYRL